MVHYYIVIKLSQEVAIEKSVLKRKNKKMQKKAEMKKKYSKQQQWRIITQLKIIYLALSTQLM